MAVQQGAAPDSGTAAPRLLVVESDAQTAAMAHRCLARAGFSVEVCSCIAQAMVWVERSWPDLVVLDPRLPGDDGFAFQRLRACYPKRTKLYVILDNLHQVHDHPRFLAIARTLGITLVFTPTEASWLNAIEPHFGVLKRFTLAGTDDRSHVQRRRRIYRYLRWRDRTNGIRGHPLQRLRSVSINKLEEH